MPRVHAGGALDGLLDLVFPRRCVVCRAPGAWLCATCAEELRPLPEDRCRRCGAPLRRAGRPARPSRAGSTAPRMPACSRVRRPRLRLLVRLSGLLLRRSGARAGHRLQVPRAALAHRRPRGARGAGVRGRRLRRPATAPSSPRCRPTATTASSAASTSPSPSPGRLARDAGLTYAPLLRRVRHGARQSGLDRASRAANVHHAFALRDGAFGVGNRLKRVIIIDDVYTTGETLNQCAEALAQAALDPRVFTFARTVRATPTPASRDHAVPKERCR